MYLFQLCALNPNPRLAVCQPDSLFANLQSAATSSEVGKPCTASSSVQTSCLLGSDSVEAGMQVGWGWITAVPGIKNSKVKKRASTKLQSLAIWQYVTQTIATAGTKSREYS